MFVTRIRLPEAAFAACSLGFLRFISSLRFRVCEALSVLRASGYGFFLIPQRIHWCFLSGLVLHQGFFFRWCDDVEKVDASSTDEFLGFSATGEDSRRFSWHSCTSPAALCLQNGFLPFFLFFFFLLAPAQGTDPKVSENKNSCGRPC